MKKTLATALRALARRLDPPAPVTIVMHGINSLTANQISAQIDWVTRTGF